MPPRILRPAVQQPWKCPSCSSRRTFAITSIRPSIGPESPRYIDIPEPPQQDVPYKPFVKGILPKPRDIFHGKSKRPGRGLEKAQEKYLALRTKEPQPHNVRDVPDESLLAWKQRMAEMRRKNLREGVEALKDRRVKTQARLTRAGKQKNEEREALLHRPEREDERLTNPSIAVDLQDLMKGKLQDPDREVRLQQMKDRAEQKEAARREEREEALHALYMQARNFITNEAQLSQAIDKQFGTPEDPVDLFDGSSVWDNGPPMSVQDMLQKANQAGGKSAMETKDRTSLTNARIKQIAEELTGGRMERR